MLMVLAVMSGGGAMAMATQIGDEGTDNLQKEDPAKDHEPVDPDVNDRTSPGGHHDGQELTGTQASATQMREGGLEDDVRDDQVTQLFPFKTPLLRIM